VSQHNVRQGSEGAIAPATVVAPAKLTLSLRIVGRRSDGYHLLDAELVSIDLADEVTFGSGNGLEIIDAGPHDGPQQQVPRGDDNLVCRALHAVGRRAHVRLVKRIPPGAGLGGGSTDGAAVLRWAGRSGDVALAASLGADVPFCLRGGRARVGGIGDELESLPYRPENFTLLIPPFGCDTGAVYRAWDELGGPTDEQGRNDLTPAALALEPRLRAWRDRLQAATGQTPVLAGSGSTWFVAGAYPGDGRVVVHTVPPW
jgi:4-diphosphocytidyl-2-C-methyl-D-erythritol kinase